MRSSANTCSLAFVFLVAIAGFGALACEEVEEAFDCQDLCEEISECEDSLIDEDRCRDRCFDVVEENKELRREVDHCSDCLKDGYTCAQAKDHCPVCVDVGEEIFGNLDRHPFEPPAGDAGAAKDAD